MIKPRPEMAKPYAKLLETARRVATVCEECKLPIDVEKYVEQFKLVMMEIMYEWASGAKFVDICKMTTIFEGTITRCTRRLGRAEGELACR